MPQTLVTAEMRIKAKGLRKSSTRGEDLLWYELRDLKSEGLKFRRQGPIGPYVADFICFDPKVIVEVDGDLHEMDERKRHDANRDWYLRDAGYLVLRYDAGDALDNAWHIAQDVKDKAGALPRLPHSRPSARGEGTGRRTAEATPPGSLREPPSPQGGGERRGLSPLAAGPEDGRDPWLAPQSPKATEGATSEGTVPSCYLPTSAAPRIAHRVAASFTAPRTVPEETPVALSYAGTTHAVMMASPADLEDFALGFSLTEGIVASPDEIEMIEVQDVEMGIDIQIRLKDSANTKFQARRRMLAGPVGCGLCGIESIEAAMRSARQVGASKLRLSAEDITSAVRLLSKAQPMHAETGAVHAAGFYLAGKGIVAVREDVGRHNALDKLAGALSKAGVECRTGAVVVTSRVSVEMVQKTAAIGSPIIIAVSAPTALAIRTADDIGMTLVALVRGEEFDIFTHSERVTLDAAPIKRKTAHVA